MEYQFREHQSFAYVAHLEDAYLSCLNYAHSWDPAAVSREGWAHIRSADRRELPPPDQKSPRSPSPLIHCPPTHKCDIIYHKASHFYLPFQKTGTKGVFSVSHVGNFYSSVSMVFLFIFFILELTPLVSLLNLLGRVVQESMWDYMKHTHFEQQN